MSTSLLYHMFGIRGYEYRRTEFYQGPRELHHRATPRDVFAAPSAVRRRSTPRDTRIGSCRPCPSAEADLRPPQGGSRHLLPLRAHPPSQGPLRRSASDLHACLRTLRPGAVAAHDHPGRGPAPGRQLGHHQGHPEAELASSLRQTEAQEPQGDRHRRDRDRQGPSLLHRGPGSAQREPSSSSATARAPRP